MKRKLLFILTSIALLIGWTTSTLFGQEQFYLSEDWVGTGGQMAMFYKNVSKTDANLNVYMAGSTLNANYKNDILLQKFNSSGTLIWQRTFNGLANDDDMASDLFIDNQYNIYVTGVSTQSVQNNLDLVVLKYNSSGTLLWSYYYNGTANGYDIGTAITGDNNGKIYVTGTSINTATMADYVTMRIDASTGTVDWTTFYDYTQLNDVPSKIEISNNTLYVTGGSQIVLSPEQWELATLRYDMTNGTLIQSRRSTSSTSGGIDEVYDLTIDDTGNIYLVGARKNANNDFDVAVYKLDSDLTLVWERLFDGHGANDKGLGIKTDTQGNIYVTGYTTSPTEGENYAVLKYNSGGTLQWSREFNGIANGNDRAVQVVLRNDNEIYVAGKIAKNNSTVAQTVGYTDAGELFTQVIFETNVATDIEPTGLSVDLDGNLILVGKAKLADGSIINNTVKYAIATKPFTPVFVNGIPSHNQSEVIVRFDRSAINTATIDRPNYDAGILSDFLTPTTITALNTHFKANVSGLKTFKIFRRMTTADSLSVTRLGDTIKVDDFWATLSIMLPNGYDEQDVSDAFNTVDKTIVHYAGLNYIGTLNSVPNDPLYSTEQASLAPTTSYPDAHINIEQAWDIETGRNYVKVGVYDYPVYWAHEDFGDGTWGDSKIVGGWDFEQNTHIKNNQSPDGNHGTAVAGIIGALRNNGKGIAGIAGGNFQNGNRGVQLFSMGIIKKGVYLPSDFVPNSIVASAIVEGALQTTNGYGYGLNIQNHSWGNPSYDVVLEKAVKTAWKNHCVLVASRGNGGHAGNPINYPACFNDEMILNVGASGVDGEHKNITNGGFLRPSGQNWESSYGNGIDFTAPGACEVITSVRYTGAPDEYSGIGYTSALYPDYQRFSGTSAAAPHVAGVTALMYSKHNVHNGAPNNLTTEDVENILQKTATDKGANGYDQYNGWGLINAYEALKAVNYPEYYVIHNSTIHGSNWNYGPTNSNLTLPNKKISISNS